MAGVVVMIVDVEMVKVRDENRACCQSKLCHRTCRSRRGGGGGGGGYDHGYGGVYSRRGEPSWLGEVSNVIEHTRRAR